MSDFAPGVHGNAAPSSRGDSVGRKLVGSGQYSKRFFIPSAFLSALQCYASYMLRSFLCNEGARYTIKIGMRRQWRKPHRGNEIRDGFRLTDPEFDDQNAAGR